MFTNQSHNNVDGDLINGDKNDNRKTTVINIAPTNGPVEELHKLYEKLKKDGHGDSSGGSFSAKLLHYMSSTTDDDVRGLQAKLKDSGREYLVQSALRMKEQAAKSMMKYQTSKTAQRVFTLTLADLHSRFTLTVTPVIQAGADPVEVDQCIQSVIQATQSMLGENVLEFDPMDLLGMLYFLGGNCHIRWDKC